MKMFLLLIPLITSVLGVLIYKHQDKRKEVFRLDLVQFVYLFIMAPTLYVWMKSFIFYILRNELQFSLSVTELFIIDTIFSILSFVVFAALAIHSLTKTFWIKRHHDPKFDLYHLSEYFHLWWSHIIIWGGAMLLVSFVALTNVFSPLNINLTKELFIFTHFLGVISGAGLFLFIWMSDPKQGNFMRLMKLLLVFFFVIHIVFYFIFDPKFNSHYTAYWFSLFMFMSAAGVGSLFERYERLNWFRKIMLHAGWGDNKGVELFSIKRKKK